MLLWCFVLLFSTMLYAPLAQSDTSDTVNVISPNGGETIYKGDGNEITVKWACSATDENVIIYLIKGNDEIKWYMGTQPAGTQTASFDIPDYATYGSDYRIKVSIGSPPSSPYDYSDGYFTIKRGFDTEAYVIAGVVIFAIIALVVILYPRKK